MYIIRLISDPSVKTQRNDLTTKQLDVLNTMSYLRKHLNDNSKNDSLPAPVGSSFKAEMLNTSSAVQGSVKATKPSRYFNKALMLTPQHFYVLYMHFGKRNKKV